MKKIFNEKQANGEIPEVINETNETNETIPKLQMFNIKCPKWKLPELKNEKAGAFLTKIKGAFIKAKDSVLKGKDILLKKVRQAGGKEPKETQPGKPQKVILGIGAKIALCFTIPLIFMIAVGVSSYSKAQEGMSENFQDATLQTIEMAREYIDTSCGFVESEVFSYAFDGELGKYFAGMFEKDQAEKNSLINTVQTDMRSSQTVNPFVQDIHIIPGNVTGILTTSTNYTPVGIMEEYKADIGAEGKKVPTWIDSHPLLDQHLELSSEEYILVYETMTKNNGAVLVADIKASTVQEFLNGLDLGEGSIVGLVTSGGRELISEKTEEGQESVLPEGEKVFYGQEFFNQINEENMSGIDEVEYLGEDYIFIYSRSEEIGYTVCTLVPEDVVVGQAKDIRNLTIGFVLIASIIVLAVGIVIVSGIQKNMKRISRKFGEVAKGDLTVQVRASGRDEFQNLAGSATNMIVNTKKLVNKVANSTKHLEESANGVDEVSKVIDQYSVEIANAIDGINEGMEVQSRHAQQCVDLTDVLSDDIQEVGRVVEKVEKLVSETEDMINRGVEIIRLLGERAKQTTEVTDRVMDSIKTLKKESEIINTFVDTISSISSQTNLLSLNASIEAARAGEAGRGFSVVAEEIRKLADDSAKAAKQIRNNVTNIGAQTVNSVQSANQAQDMVAAQTEAVEQAVVIFGEMRQQMSQLVQGLNDIVVSIEKADTERIDTVQAVKDISNVIEETAASAEVVKNIASRLAENVENLNHTAGILGDNMDDLKSEISVFKI